MAGTVAPGHGSAAARRAELGQVIAGDIGSGSLGPPPPVRTSRMAQRMESVARQVGDAVGVHRPPGRASPHRRSGSRVRIKGSGRSRIIARRLVAIQLRRGTPARADGDQAGRRPGDGDPEFFSTGPAMAAAVSAGDRAAWHREEPGGPEVAARAAERHERVLGLLRHILATFSSASSPNCCARSPVWMAWTTSRPRAYPRTPPGRRPGGSPAAGRPARRHRSDTLAPQIDPDAWRRRVVARSPPCSPRTNLHSWWSRTPHWIDVGSESLLAELPAAIHRTRAIVLGSPRDRVRRRTTPCPGSSGDSPCTAGRFGCRCATGGVNWAPDPVGGRPAVAERTVGNPFFAE